MLVTSATVKGVKDMGRPTNANVGLYAYRICL